MTRKRDPIWDAVCEAFQLRPVTKRERTRVGGIVRDLKLKEAQPSDVWVRLARYRAQWPNAADTPEALLKHWDRFATPPKPEPGRIRSGQNVYGRVDFGGDAA
jgi:hypothetical protein